MHVLLKEEFDNKAMTGLQLIQKMKNKLFKNEIIEINKRMTEKRLKAVNIKGLLLADDLYTPPETRIFGDIDLLINKEDLEPTLTVFSELGYKVIKEDSFTNSRFKLDEPAMKNINQHIANVFSHIDVLRKNVNNISVDVELHLNIANRYEYNTNTRRIISRADVVIYDGNTLYQLELHDRLLHLAIHFCKHLAIHCGTEMFTCKPKDRVFLLTKFYDIILFIHKYRNVISFEEIVKRSIEMIACDKMALVFKIFNGIYENEDMIPVGIIEKLIQNIEYKNDLYRNAFIYYLLDENQKELIFFDYYKFSTSLFYKIGYHDQYLCSFDMPKYGNYIINKYNYGDYEVIKRHQVSYYTCWWNKFYIFFQIRVYHDNPEFPDINDIGHEQNSIEIMICDQEFNYERPFVRKFRVLPGVENTTIRVKIKDTTSNQILEDKCSDIAVYHDGYNVKVGLPWKVLGDVPFIAKHIYFNLGIYYYDSINSCINGNIVMAPESPTDSDPTHYGVLILTN
jgi:hypothetical protein